ncbi:AMP-binding protein [Streptomyces sp. NRRL S-87]|uniref:AMP-binding protein n=1 Tax=Streptomyces sp. NRRL S-87 TaxID=1463920 RepID=UPI00068B0334|nr:AMP-binding protein [Streptomyces sp. NRRL S-87]
MVHLWTLLERSLREDTLLHTPRRRTEPVSGPQLLARAERTAGAVLAALDGVRPTRVGLLMANGEPWVRGLLAAFRLDAAAVPLALPVAFGGADAYAEHVRRIADDAGLEVMLVDGSVGRRIVSRVAEAVPAVRFVDIAQPPAERAVLPGLTGGGARPAVVQYTSGSTSAPKGVLVSHDNAAAGLDVIAAGTGWAPDDVLGQWLPLFHDMGLFSLLNALRRGSSVHLWEPGDFVRRPLAWLSEFAACGATMTPAPNFFYDYLVAAAAREGVPEGLDLSRWRYGGNGSEPVRLASLHAFRDAFAPHGLGPQVVQPNYGMAEATLMVSTGAPRSPYRSVDVDRAHVGLGDRLRYAAEPGPGTRTVVSCGQPVAGVRVRIGTPEGAELPADTAGEVQITGAPVTAGYLGLPTAAQPFTPDGWLRTGDIGFLHQGELHLLGRLKAMAVVRGHNYYAEDVEEVVKATPGAGRQCAAFAWGAADDEGAEERMVVLWETRLDRAAAAAVGRAIAARLAEHLGLGAVDVVPVPTSALPFTSSGKVRRSGAADLYRAHLAEAGTDDAGTARPRPAAPPTGPAAAARAAAPTTTAARTAAATLEGTTS